MMTAITRWVLAHKRLVAGTWIVLTLVGIATVGDSVKAFSNTFSVPGREGFVTNAAITRIYHSGGNNAPLLAVVKLPAGGSVTIRSRASGTAAGRGEAAGSRSRRSHRLLRIHRESGVRVGGRPHDVRDRLSTSGQPVLRPEHQGRKTGDAALGERSVAGAPVLVTGVDALQSETGGANGPGVFVETVLGGLGALVVLVFVFASLLALVPIMMAVVAIIDDVPRALRRRRRCTSVSFIVEFLVALIGLGVAIDYSLLVVVRWREERIIGHEGDEAVVRAMADRRTRGRVQRHDGRDRLAGDGRAAAPVPAFDRLRRAC